MYGPWELFPIFTWIYWSKMFKLEKKQSFVNRRCCLLSTVVQCVEYKYLNLGAGNFLVPRGVDDFDFTSQNHIYITLANIA